MMSPTTIMSMVLKKNFQTLTQPINLPVLTGFSFRKIRKDFEGKLVTLSIMEGQNFDFTFDEMDQVRDMIALGDVRLLHHTDQCGGEPFIAKFPNAPILKIDANGFIFYDTVLRNKIKRDTAFIGNCMSMVSNVIRSSGNQYMVVGVNKYDNIFHGNQYNTGNSVSATHEGQLLFNGLNPTALSQRDYFGQSRGMGVFNYTNITNPIAPVHVNGFTGTYDYVEARVYEILGFNAENRQEVINNQKDTFL